MVRLTQSRSRLVKHLPAMHGRQGIVTLRMTRLSRGRRGRDGIDNDCDGEAEENLEFRYFYPDEDGDGVGVAVGDQCDALWQGRAKMVSTPSSQRRWRPVLMSIVI